jgi:hypothetical protein
MDDALARLDAELASVDPSALASADGAILAAACARVATAALDSARRSEDALQWARAALHYDPTNEEARWCEAKSLDALNRRLALAIKRYEELAALDTSAFGALARQRLDTGTVRQRYQQQVEALSPGNALNEESPVKNLKGVGEKTVEELPSKGSTPLREAVEHVRASGRKPGKKLESMFTALNLVDEKPEAANEADGTAKPHVGLLERTLRSRRSKGVKMLSWNIKSMNVIDYKDAEFAQIVQEKAANYASAATEAGADLLLVQEAPGPQLLHHGGAAARRSAECHAFEEALQRGMSERGGRRWEVASVTVPRWDEERKLEMGEGHAFAWNPDVLAPVEPPALLEPAEADAAAGVGFHRSPSWCGFEVKRSGDWNGTRLVVVNVHCKSGGGDGPRETVDDVKTLARAVAALKAKQPDGAVVLLTGDFNLEPPRVLAAFASAGLDGFGSALDGRTATNLWRFNVEQGHGHVYDGIYHSGAKTGRIGGGVLEIEAIDVAYREMVEVAARLAESGGRGEVARRVLAGTGAEAKVGDDGVPTWLRKRFQAEVHRQYSDHLPVYCMLS